MSSVDVAQVPPRQATPAPEVRPSGVTFAGVAAIVYGAMGIVTGMLAAVFNAFLSIILWPFLGWATWGGPEFGVSALTGFAPFLGIPIIVIAAIGLVAGVAVLGGRHWARWTLVALYALGALAFIGGGFSVIALLFLGVNAYALVGLLNEAAKRYFDADQPPTP